MNEINNSDRLKAAKGAGASLIGSFVGRGLWFLSQVIIARFFGAETFGLYILGITIVKITELLARFGLHTGSMRFVSIYRKGALGRLKGILLSAYSISFINGVFIGGIVYLFAEFLSGSVFHKPELSDVIKYFSLCVPFMSSMMVIAISSRGFHTTKYDVYIREIIQPAANISFIIIFLFLDFGIFAIINAFIISHMIALIVGLYFITLEFPGIKDSIIIPVFEAKALFAYSVPLVFGELLLFLMRWTDIIMVGIFMSPSDVGMYRAASQIPLFLTLILMASNSMYAPMIADMHHHGQLKRFESIFKTTTRWVFLITLPLALIIIFSAKEIISLFGRDFIENGVPVLMVLTVAQFINCTTGGVGFTLTMTGKQNIELINSSALLILNILLNYMFIPLYGALGAATATAISISLVNFLRLMEVYFIFRIHPYNKSYIKGLFSGGIGVVILFVLGWIVQESSNLERFFMNSIAIGITFGVTFLISGIDEEDRFIFRVLSNRLTRK